MTYQAKALRVVAPHTGSAFDFFEYQLRVQNAAMVVALLYGGTEQPEAEMVDLLRDYVQGDACPPQQMEAVRQRLHTATMGFF